MKHLFVLVLVCTVFVTKSLSQNTTITGSFTQLNDGDTVKLFLYPYGQFTQDYPELTKTFVSKVKNKTFHFNIHLGKNQLIEYRLDIPKQMNSYWFNELLLEYGDHIHLYGDNTKCDFSGKGSYKLSLLKQFKIIEGSIKYNGSLKNYALNINSKKRAVKLLDSLLSHNKARLTKNAFQFLKSGANNLEGYYFSFAAYRPHNDTAVNIIKENWADSTLHDESGIVSSPLTNSALTSRLIARICLLDYLHTRNPIYFSPSKSLRIVYDQIKQNYSGALKDKLLTYLVLAGSASKSLPYCFSDALETVKNPVFLKALKNHLQCVPGMKAMDFAFQDTARVIHRLSDYKGKIVVLDFWFTGCGSCRALTPYLRKVEETFQNKPNVVFISVSIDKTIPIWKSGINSGFYTTSKNEIKLYTNGLADKDPFIVNNNISGAPSLRLIDQRGNWCENPKICTEDDGADLIRLINNNLEK